MYKFHIAISAFIFTVTSHAQLAGSGIAPRFLADAGKPDEIVRQVTGVKGATTVAAEGGKLVFTVAQSHDYFPGAAIKALDAATFDFSLWSRVEARVTNTSAQQLGIGMSVQNAVAANDEHVWLQPGQSAPLVVWFGYELGFQPARTKVDPRNITQVFFYTHGSPAEPVTFTIDDLKANGAAGEKPPANPGAAVTRIPENGNIFGRGAPFDAAAQLHPHNATATVTAANTLACTFAENAWVSIKPPSGVWTFRDGNAITIGVKNTGSAPANPTLQIASRNDARTDPATLPRPLAPGASAKLTASFVPKIPWAAGEITGKYNAMKDGTGTKFESRYGTDIHIFADAGAQLEIFAVILVVETDPIPPWLGKQPPVPQEEWGKWKLTFNENFDDALDPETWNFYTDNYWDRRTHFSKTNNIVENGKMILRYEKRRGYHNDDPNETWGDKGQTDYVCGFADTYGKWTQRYGYFEARMKLPRADGLWPCFWTMPDRGVEHGPEQWKRANTGDNGMEFDIMENLSGWGPYRFNQAFHWDGYGPDHKAVGSAWVYVRPDSEGFITIGLLWLPGLAVYYSNGREIGRMENPRVCSVQSNLILYTVSGGWDNTWADDTQLPADFVIDYVRAWQRADLATAEDGFKPNDGRPKMHMQYGEFVMPVTDEMRERAAERAKAVVGGE